MEISGDVVLSFAGVVTVIGGAWITVRKIVKDAKKDKEDLAESILETAKEEIALKELAFESKIREVNQRVDSLEDSINKDLEHLKESYNNEMRSLSNKIETLRDELRGQHANLLTLITKLIENTKN